MAKEGSEQAVEEVIETPQADAPEASGSEDGISEILSKALTGQGEPTTEDAEDKGTEEDNPDAEGEESTEEVESEEDSKAGDGTFGNLTFDGKKMLTFKTEEDFKKFVESNPLIKDSFLRQSDYTRKTSALAEERRKFEEERKKVTEQMAIDDESWGVTKPTKDDLQSFKTLWHVFQHGSDHLSSKIASFFQDVGLLANGKQPVGPLLGNQEEQVDYSGDARMIGFQRQFETYKQEQERKERERQNQDSLREQEKVSELVSGWLKNKSDAGNPIPQDELMKMSEISKHVKVDHKTFTLDDLHILALQKLGKSQKTAIQKVVKKIDQKSRQTPRAPMSRTSSNSQPEAETLDDILNQGISKLKGE